MSVDPYQILGVSPSSTPDEIKAAWHQRVKQYHPDRLHHAGSTVRAAAEDMTKLLNVAYDELMRRQGASREPNPGSKSPFTQVVTGRDLMQRGTAALDFADGLMSRWRTAALTIGVIERRIDDALALALKHRAGARELHSAIFSRGSVIGHEVWEMLHERFVRPLEARIAVLRQGLETNPAAALKVAEEMVSLVDFQPEGMALLLGDMRDKAHQTATMYLSKTGSLRRSCEELPAAQKRARDAYRRGKHAVQEIADTLVKAREALDRAILVIWTAWGLCEAEKNDAKGAEANWVAERAAHDAEQVKVRSEMLEAEQSRAEAQDWAPTIQRCAEKNNRLGETIKETQSLLADVLKWSESAADEVDRIGPSQMQRLESSIQPYLTAANKALSDRAHLND